MKKIMTTAFLALSVAAGAQTTQAAPAGYGGPQAVLYIAPMSCGGGSCGNNAGAEFEAALTQALQNSGYFRVVKREDVANLSISGGVTNIDGGSTKGFLFFAQSKVKVKAAIQVSDPDTGELVFTQQCEGDSTSNALSIFGFTSGENSGYGKAAADCATQLTQAIAASNRIQPFLKYAPGAALPGPRSAAAPAAAPAPLYAAAYATAPAPAAGAGVTADQASGVVRMLDGTVKSLAFSDLNTLFSSDVLNPVRIKALNAAANPATLQNAAKMTFKVTSSENTGLMQVVGITYTLPNGTERYTQLGVLGDGPAAAQLNPRGGTKFLYMSAFNPMRSAMPQLELLSKNAETFVADVTTALGLPTQ